MKSTKPDNRRNFLLAAGLGSAAAAAVAVTGVRKVHANAALAAEAAKPSGYHVSEHIMKYYKTTKV